MSTLHITLPDALESFINEQVAHGGYDTGGEYVRDLIRKDQERTRLRDLLLQGAASAPTRAADATYFDGLRQRVHQQAR